MSDSYIFKGHDVPKEHGHNSGLSLDRVNMFILFALAVQEYGVGMGYQLYLFVFKLTAVTNIFGFLFVLLLFLVVFSGQFVPVR